MSKPPDRKALGKGLSALLPSRGPAPAAIPVETASAPADTQTGARMIPTDLIDRNPEQPRTQFNQEKLQELAQSIRANGIIQPLILQKAGERYQIIAGERRWRAAQLARLSEVPAVVQELAADRLLEVALIENIQREDLNPLEVAHALERLAQDYNLSQEEIGRRTGKDRATVANLIRLLRLPHEVQALVADGKLTMGHARALLGLQDPRQQSQLAEKVVAEGLSVRQTERLVQILTHKPKEGPEPEKPKHDPNVTAAQRELEAALGTRVRIVTQNAGKGRIEIDYFSAEELDRLYNALLGN